MAHDAPGSTTTRVEVNFERLLVRSEALASDADVWSNDRRNLQLSQFIRRLREQFDAIQRDGHSSLVWDERCEDYQHRLHALEDMDDDGRSQMSHLLVASRSVGGNNASGPVLRRKLLGPVKTIPTVQLPMDPRSNDGAAASPVSSTASTMKPYADVIRRRGVGAQLVVRGGRNGVEDDALSHHMSQQTQLTEEMAAMSAAMLTSAHDIHSIVVDSSRDIDTLADLTEANATAIGAENKRLREQIRSSCSFTCWSMLVLVIVCIVFVWTYMFIRFVPKR